MVFTEEQKEEVIFNFFDEVLGRSRVRQGSLNFHTLGIPSIDPSSINESFSEPEVWKVISDMPSEKVPGPDGFTGLFYKKAWSVIEHDVLQAFNALAALDCREFHHVNGAYMILLPKKKMSQVSRTTDRLVSSTASIRSSPRPYRFG